MISGSGSTLFEELGLYYIGPVDGHNLDTIISILQGAAALPRSQARGPVAGLLQHCAHAFKLENIIVPSDLLILVISSS